MKQRGRGHQTGRGYEISEALRRRVFQLYSCQGVPGDYLFSVEKIAKMTELDPKSIRRMLRDELVSLLSKTSLATKRAQEGVQDRSGRAQGCDAEF